MADQYLCELRIFSFNYPPRGWAFCNGQLLSINQNQPVFALLGTTYGGNGQTTFGLPNLQGSVPMHIGNGFAQGQPGGEVNHTLTIPEMPAHTHVANGSVNPPIAATPVNNFWASGTASYNPTANENMSPAAISNAGGSQSHNNMAPYLTLNICIALQGIFPSRN